MKGGKGDADPDLSEHGLVKPDPIGNPGGIEINFIKPLVRGGDINIIVRLLVGTPTEIFGLAKFRELLLTHLIGRVPEVGNHPRIRVITRGGARSSANDTRHTYSGGTARLVREAGIREKPKETPRAVTTRGTKQTKTKTKT